MSLRTKLEKLERELKGRKEETKIVIKHQIINEKGEVEEIGVQEIIFEEGIGTKIAKEDPS